MKKQIIKVGSDVLQLIYNGMKCRPQKKQVAFLSRQGNSPGLDFVMLGEELNKRDIPYVMLCRKMGDGLAGKAEYAFHILKQMSVIAASKVAILDSYCIPISILKHRDNLKVIQMWHALGAMKKFGRSILDMPEGRDSVTADAMRMHCGYDYIFTSSEKSRPGFAEAFGYPEDKLTVMSLPRVDALLDEERNAKLKAEITAEYPVMKNKYNILYAPTLRVNKDMNDAVRELINAVDTDRYNLIIKAHPLMSVETDDVDDAGIIVDRKHSTIDMMSACDCVITDYSAVTYEAAIKGLPLIFYAYDKSEYVEGRNWYLDYDSKMPGPICADAASVMREISQGISEEYCNKEKTFADEYIEKKENCTQEIADLIEKLLNE